MPSHTETPMPPAAVPAGPLRTIRLLVAARALRSVGQGALVVDFSLYLHRLGWGAVPISVVPVSYTHLTLPTN